MKITFTLCILFLSITLSAQTSIVGTWNTGQENTIVEIDQENEHWLGKIQSSDNTDAVIGKTILKDLEPKGDSWTGLIFLAKRQKWAKVKITSRAAQLDLVVTYGLLKKRLAWSQEK